MKTKSDIVYVLLAAAKLALEVFISHAGYGTLLITPGSRCICCDACSPYLLTLCQEFTAHARASGWGLCSRCSMQLAQNRTKQFLLTIIFANLLQPLFFSSSWQILSFPEKIQLGMTSIKQPCLIFSVCIRHLTYSLFIRKCELKEWHCITLHPVTYQAYTMSSINIQLFTPLTLDSLWLFIGTNQWIVNQTDWVLLRF